MQGFTDYYKILGIKKDATSVEIKKAYRKMVSKYHPDKNLNKSPEAQKLIHEMFIKVQDAYDTLKDPIARRIYDKTYGQVNKKMRFTSVYTDDGGNIVVPSEDYSDVWDFAKKADSTLKRGKYEEVANNSKDQKQENTLLWQNHGKYERLDDDFDYDQYVEKLREISSRRYKKKNKKTFSIKNGIVIVTDIFLAQMDKLKIQRGDTFRKYIVRNRGKFAGLVVCAGIATGLYLSKKEDPEVIIFEPPAISTEYEESTEISTVEETATESVTEETIAPAEEPFVTLYRVHTVVPGDTLSRFSADSNTTIETLKNVNHMNSNTVMLGTDLMVPYIIDKEDLHFYSKTAVYNPNESIEDFAREFETDVNTLEVLNRGVITFDLNTNEYIIATDVLSVPNFITKDDYRVLKAAESIQNSYSKK